MPPSLLEDLAQNASDGDVKGDGNECVNGRPEVEVPDASLELLRQVIVVHLLDARSVHLPGRSVA